MRFALFAVASTAIALTAASPSASQGAQAAIRISDAWSRPVAAGLPNGVVYLSIANLGRRPDRLIGAQTPVAARLTLHRSAMSHGVMSMASLPDGADIPAGGVLELQPGGYHLMLEGLKGGLKPGARFPATLRFANAGRVTVDVRVQAAPPSP